MDGNRKHDADERDKREQKLQWCEVFPIDQGAEGNRDGELNP